MNGAQGKGFVLRPAQHESSAVCFCLWIAIFLVQIGYMCEWICVAQDSNDTKCFDCLQDGVTPIEAAAKEGRQELHEAMVSQTCLHILNWPKKLIWWRLPCILQVEIATPSTRRDVLSRLNLCKYKFTLPTTICSVIHQTKTPYREKVLFVNLIFFLQMRALCASSGKAIESFYSEGWWQCCRRTFGGNIDSSSHQQ